MRKRTLLISAIAALCLLVGCGPKQVEPAAQQGESAPVTRMTMSGGKIVEINGDVISVNPFEAAQGGNVQRQQGGGQGGNVQRQQGGGQGGNVQRQQGGGQGGNVQRQQGGGQSGGPIIRGNPRFTDEVTEISVSGGTKYYRVNVGGGASVDREEIALSDLKKDDVITVEYNSDKSEVLSVQVMDFTVRYNNE